MGKNYYRELTRLQETYDWARQCDLRALVVALSDCRDLPLVAVGSGGSYAIASFVSMLHEEFLGYPAKHLTPLELTHSATLERRGVLLVSARGNNPDIVEAIHLVGRKEPPVAVVVLLNAASKAARVCEQYPYVRTLLFEPPVKKDGYVATNSMVAFATLLTRAYEQLTNIRGNAPVNLPRALLEGSSPTDVRIGSTAAIPSVLSILYGGWGAPAAIDLESKMTEAAIGFAQVSDYRNFAHGRHYWIAKHGPQVATLSLVTPDTERLAHRTNSLLPDNIASYTLAATRGGPWGGLELLVGAMDFIASAASSQGIDPGRPSVPPFGRRMYRLSQGAAQASAGLDFVIQRKLGAPMGRWGIQVLAAAREQLQTFLSQLRTARFDSLVFDYDGTLCAEEYRRSALPGAVTKPIQLMLEQGIQIGVATGRGRSVRAALRKSLPRALWPLVTIGYYNGAETSSLVDPAPDRDGPSSEPLRTLHGLIAEHPVLDVLCSSELRPKQLTISPSVPMSLRTLHRLVLELVITQQLPVLVVRSSSSVDVTGLGVSKLAVLHSIRRRRAKHADMEILTIADGGSWDGNDLSLLSAAYSLTVHDSPRVAPNGWNLAPPGHQGVAGTLFYLASLRVMENEFRVDLDRLLEWTSESIPG